MMTSQQKFCCRRGNTSPGQQVRVTFQTGVVIHFRRNIGWSAVAHTADAASGVWVHVAFTVVATLGADHCKEEWTLYAASLCTSTKW
jgi:hypothetical protein